jgi:hypothetical protein
MARSFLENWREALSEREKQKNRQRPQPIDAIVKVARFF